MCCCKQRESINFKQTIQNMMKTVQNQSVFKSNLDNQWVNNPVLC